MTKPDHSRARTPYAVAIENDLDDAPPRITATGRGAFAEQILAIAFAHGVRVREDADLAAVLAALDVDSPIPPAAIATVAEILSYVYRADGPAPGAP